MMERLLDAVCRDGRIARLPYPTVCGMLGLDKDVTDYALSRELGVDGETLMWYWRE